MNEQEKIDLLNKFMDTIAKAINKEINEEIRWQRENPAWIEYSKGVVSGLIQAKYIISELPLELTE